MTSRLMVTVLFCICDSIVYTYISADSNCNSTCDGSESSPYATIQQASDNRRSNNLMLLSGTYTGKGNINVTISQLYTRITTEYPNDPSRTLIDCEENGWFLSLLSDAYHINGLTIQNCIASSREQNTNISQTLGGALFIQNVGIANVSNCVFENNRADIGGAIYIYAAAVHLLNTVVRNNRADVSSGGVHMENGDLKLLKATLIEDNESKGNGGGIYVKSSSVNIYNESDIKSNTADDKGHNVYCDNGWINLWGDSDIDGSIICVKCAVHKFNSNGHKGNDLCSSDHPNNNGGMNASERTTIYVSIFLIIFIIALVIVCTYCYKKKQSGGNYEGLLEN